MHDDDPIARLSAARSGAEWAWASIYRDLAPAVRGYLRGRGAHDPDDLTGEVFLQVVRDLHRFNGDEREFRTWVFSIAHHRIVDAGRRRSRRPAEPMADPPRGAAVVHGDVEEEALQHVGAHGVRRIIEQLVPDQRDVLLLRIIGQLTVQEVADVVRKSPGAVKATQRRGLRAIERLLANEGVPL